MPDLPNPFFIEPATAEGRCQEVPAAVAANPHETAGAFDSRFVLDERAFMEAIEPGPAFLIDPSPEYLAAAEIVPVLAVLAGH